MHRRASQKIHSLIVQGVATMSDDPLAKFHTWWDEVKRDAALKHPGAVCVSTVSADGEPSARFVDLKSADDQGFTFCTWFDSRKGKEIAQNPNVALTFWWEAKGYQVRVEGVAQRACEQQSESWWSTRSRDAQLTTLCFQQSQPLSGEDELAKKLRQAKEETAGQPIEKPERWGGVQVIPRTIEFLTFRDNRLHLRELYTRTEDRRWEKQLLQP